MMRSSADNDDKVIIQTLACSSNANLIVVGDVHGCLEEFNNLLRACRFREGIDVLVLVGDLVCKGPNSAGVVERAMKLGAFCTLGNYDWTLLKALRKKKLYGPGKLNPRDPVQKTALEFSAELELYLRQLPHIIRIPLYNLIVVHAGLNPLKPIEKQTPHEVMHMRRVDDTGRVVVKEERGTPWAKLWDGPENVIFGHDARAGLQREKHALGIDTGCVYGGGLTAVIYPGGRLVAVPTFDYLRGAADDDSFDLSTLATLGMLHSSPSTSPPPPTKQLLELSAAAPEAPPSSSDQDTTAEMHLGEEPSQALSYSDPACRDITASSLHIVAQQGNAEAVIGMLSCDCIASCWESMLEQPDTPLAIIEEVANVLTNALVASRTRQNEATLLAVLQDIIVARSDVKKRVAQKLVSTLELVALSNGLLCHENRSLLRSTLLAAKLSF